MGSSTRPLVPLLLLLAAAGLGLGVMQWRAAHPELVERLEQLDREIAASAEAGAEARRPARVTETRGPRPRARGEAESRPPTTARASKRQTAPLDEPKAPLDLNRATLADLTRLPGVGPVLARRIVETRDAVGRFGEVDDLVTVRGLGRVKLERLRPFIGVLE